MSKKIGDVSGSILVSSTIKSVTFLQKAESLASKLNFPYTRDISEIEDQMVLCYTDVGLKLLAFEEGKDKSTELLYVDFVGGKHGYRRKFNNTIKQPLAKAIGIKPGVRPTVFDATAGLGADSFVLATLGCEVTLCERNVVMATLLEDGIERARASSATRKIVHRMTLLNQNSIKLTGSSKPQYETVYLDPMYPHSLGSALNKKEMRVIRQLVGDDEDSEQLFDWARDVATKRIVVKRPRQAPPLTEHPISYQLKVKSGRYDIYLIT